MEDNMLKRDSLALLFLLWSVGCTNQSNCDTAPTPTTETVRSTEPVVGQIRLNPYGNAPLSALIVISDSPLDVACIEGAKVTITPLNSDCTPLTLTLNPGSTTFEENFSTPDLLEEDELGLPVLGLCQGVVHEVDFEIWSEDTHWFGSSTVETETVPGLVTETVRVDVADGDAMEPGWTFLNARVYDGTGQLRWYGPNIYQILQNGNLLSILDEYNWLGRKVRDRSLPSHLSWHHSAIELPNGDILSLVHNSDTNIINANGDEVVSDGDHVVALGKENSEIIGEWDLRSYLDVDRNTVVSYSSDWVHTNQLAYDKGSDSIFVSGRYQGIIKLDRYAKEGEGLGWILSPHLDWGFAGWDGTGPLNPNEFLLTAVDREGAPYSDQVQKNIATAAEMPAEFHWLVGQHGLSVRPTDMSDEWIVMTFSNQGSFIFDGEGSVGNGVSWDAQGDLSNDRSEEPYSLLIEYLVNQSNGTVTELFSYGEEMPELYGSYNGGVSWLEQTGNRLMFSNGTDQHQEDTNPLNPHLVELGESGEVVFHLSIENTTLSVKHGGRVDFQSLGL